MTRGAFLHPYCRVTRDDFVTIVRGDGAVVEDTTGKQYVDGMASLWYTNVGHGRREIVEAVTKQMEKFAAYHCFEPFTNEPAEEIAVEIAGLAPMDGARIFLTSSGSEAVDSAIKLARLAHDLRGDPDRNIVISRSRVSRRHLRRPFRTRIARQPRGLRPVRRGDGQPPRRRPRSGRHRVRRARERDRGRHRRAGPGRGRRVPASRGLPRRACAACAISTARCSSSTR